MPKHNYLYSLPLAYYNDYKGRKYGFHGTSHRYVSQYEREILIKTDKKIEKFITFCHLEMAHRSLQLMVWKICRYINGLHTTFAGSDDGYSFW